MKALSLFLLRFSTGMYLVLWGLLKLIASDRANAVSDKYYSGMLSNDVMHLGIGVLQVVLGVMVIVGIYRRFGYYAQLAWYVMGIIPIMLYILDPLGLYIAESSKLTFFPSTTLLFASMILIAFKEYDTYSLDTKMQK